MGTFIQLSTKVSRSKKKKLLYVEIHGEICQTKVWQNSKVFRQPLLLAKKEKEKIYFSNKMKEL